MAKTHDILFGKELAELGLLLIRVNQQSVPEGKNFTLRSNLA
jgi:hypothetical protein